MARIFSREDFELLTDNLSHFEKPLLKNDNVFSFGPPEGLKEKLHRVSFEILLYHEDARFRPSLTRKKRESMEQVSELLREYETVEDELKNLKAKSGLSPEVDKETAELLRQMSQMLLTSCDLLLRLGLGEEVTRTKSQVQLLLSAATDAARQAEDVLDRRYDAASVPRPIQDRCSQEGRRIALVLCVITDLFSGVSNYRMMRKLFQQYGFDYTIHINPKTQEMADMVQTFRDRINRCKEDVSCCFVVSAGHGAFGTVCGCDRRTLKVDEVILPFGDEKCPKLRGKPKIFIIDACRGSRLDAGVGLNDPVCLNPMQEDEETEELKNYIQPTIQEMFSVYATQPEFVAFMSRNGSELIRNTAEVFTSASGSEHIYDLFLKVNKKMAMETYPFKGSTYKVMPQIDSTLTELFYLHPKTVMNGH